MKDDVKKMKAERVCSANGMIHRKAQTQKKTRIKRVPNRPKTEPIADKGVVHDAGVIIELKPRL